MSKWLPGGVVTWTTSGRTVRRTSVTSVKGRPTLNLSQNCWAISGSRSQAATIAHPPILRICDACASAILPHPTMATLSMRDLVTAALEIALQTLGCRHQRHPTEHRFQFRVAVPPRAPVRLPGPPVERGGQLTLRPVGVRLPEPA